MSLMQLLAVGRSLGRVNDQPSRYRLMTQQSLLPKFGPSKNSVGEPPVSERTASAAQDAPPRPTVSTLRREGIRTTQANPMKDSNNMKTAAANHSAPAAAVSPLPQQTFPHGRWTLFKNPFSGAPKPKAKTSGTPLQGELLLDAVKPVRNDLSDSDLEVVPASKPGSGVASPVAAPLSQGLSGTSGSAGPAGPAGPGGGEGVGVANGADGLIWDRLKMQFFGAGKT